MNYKGGFYMEKKIENNLDISTAEISDVDNIDMETTNLDN